jgi:hypothetical protein
MSKLGRAIEQKDLQTVQRILQRKKRSSHELNCYLAHAMEEDAPIEMFIILILGGANTLDTERYEPEDFPLVTEVLTAIPLFASLPQHHLTLEKLPQLVALIGESEPMDFPPPKDDTCRTFTVAELEANMPLTCVKKGYFLDVISSGKIDPILWLIRHYPHKVQSYHLQEAAELGFVKMAEALIMAGATMCDEWYIGNTARRVLAARRQVTMAVMLVHRGLKNLPRELRAMIADYIWDSRFDLAAWDAERDWTEQRQQAMQILNE